MSGINDIADVFMRYPIGMPIRLKDDYDWQNKRVDGYEITSSRCLIRMNDGTSVDSDRLKDMLVETPGDDC